MYKCRANDIQTQADTAYDHDKSRIFDACRASDEGSASIGQIDSRSREINLSIDCKKMLMPKARRNTPLKKAPSKRALCQPKESSAGERDRSDIWTTGELKLTAQVRPETHNDSYQSDDEADQIIHL